MERQKHERFLAANEELRVFLRRVNGLALGTESITEGDFQALSRRLSTLAPEVGDAARGEILDESLRNEIGEYVRNLHALQKALETLRCIMHTRKAHLDGSKRDLDGFQNWIDAYHQTT